MYNGKRLQFRYFSSEKVDSIELRNVDGFIPYELNK